MTTNCTCQNAKLPNERRQLEHRKIDTLFGALIDNIYYY